jgi:dolichol-phosphate mannosyltransferase
VVSPALTVVIPTLDEAANVGPLLRDLDRVLDGIDHEVLVVDGGSSDGTPERARASSPTCRVLEPGEGTGLAASVAAGLREARGEHVCVMDGDRQHPPAAVVDLLRAARWREADLVVGSRYAPDGDDPGLDGGRRALSAVARRGIAALLPSVREHGLTDPTSGFFLVRRDAVDTQALDPTGYKILLEVLETADLDVVEEVGYTFRRRAAGESNLDRERMAATGGHVLRLAAADRGNRRMAQFGAVGLLGVVVNLAVLAGLTELAGLHYAASAAVAVEASILSNFALNDAVTFRDRRQGTWSGRLGRFNLVSLLALGMNLAVLTGLTEAAGLHYLLSEAAAIGVAFLANYHGNLAWTYEAPEAEGGRLPTAGRLLLEHLRAIYASTLGRVAPALPEPGDEDA